MIFASLRTEAIMSPGEMQGLRTQFTFTFTKVWWFLPSPEHSKRTYLSYIYSNLLSSLLSFTCDRPVLIGKDAAVYFLFHMFTVFFVWFFLCRLVLSYKRRTSVWSLALVKREIVLRLQCIVVAGILWTGNRWCIVRRRLCKYIIMTTTKDNIDLWQ